MSKTQYDKDFLEDRLAIDNLSKSMLNQIAQLNKRLKTSQITDFKYLVDEKKEEVKKTLTWLERFFMWFGEKFPKKKHTCKFTRKNVVQGQEFLKCEDHKCVLTIPNYGEWIEYNKKKYPYLNK